MIFNKHRELLLSSISIEHREFILIIGKLYDASIKNLPEEIILNIMDDFINFTYFHFQWEEKNCKFCKPYLHVLKDSLLLEKIEEYRFDFESGKIGQDVLFDLVFNWLLLHLKSHEIKKDEVYNKEPSLPVFWDEIGINNF